MVLDQIKRLMPELKEEGSLVLICPILKELASRKYGGELLIDIEEIEEMLIR